MSVVALKCFVCHVKTDDWRNELRGLRSQHSSTYVTDFIKKILGDYNIKRDIDDVANCICADCLNRFEEYDWTCTMAKQYEKELYDLLIKTEELCCSEVKGEIIAVEPQVERPFVDPLNEFVEQPFRNDEADPETDLVNVMVEPLLILNDKPSDDEDNEDNEVNGLDTGVVEIPEDDPDFNCKLEADSNHEDSEDDEYLPQKRNIKAKKPKVTNIKVEHPNAPPSKKRGRKPKIREPGEVLKPRRKREKRTYECKNCDKTFTKLIEFVVSKQFFIRIFISSLTQNQQLIFFKIIYQAHKKWHREQLIPEFRCSKCFYISENQEAFDAHDKLHENVAPLQCVFCNMTFSFKGTLTKHTRIHVSGLIRPRRIFENVLTYYFVDFSRISEIISAACVESSS